MATPATANVDEELDQTSRAAGPCVMVLFGAAGDLTKRKLIPALFNLVKAGLLSHEFAVMGISKDEITQDQWKSQVTSFLNAEDHSSESWQWFIERLYYAQGEFEDIKTFQFLNERLQQIDKLHNTGGNYLFYLATAPKFFATIVEKLGESGLAREDENNWRRVVIEKPFGNDLGSAKVLNQRIRAVLHEKQIYRIDHYLGKETVQNILVF